MDPNAGGMVLTGAIVLIGLLLAASVVRSIVRLLRSRDHAGTAPVESEGYYEAAELARRQHISELQRRHELVNSRNLPQVGAGGLNGMS